jgi:hypothetical protein
MQGDEGPEPLDQALDDHPGVHARRTYSAGTPPALLTSGPAVETRSVRA